MQIWFKQFTIDELNKISAETMVGHLGIVFTESGDDYLKARMPVDQRTIQPAGLLHGGASVALAETLGSVGAYLTVDPAKYDCVGMEINANHLRPVRSGFVTGMGRPVHLGRKTQVWQIDITDDRQRLIAVSRITLSVVPRLKEK